ncbi:NnrU family protein [Halieaceae bacterium]|nr:NnrU family protein [Halieaceae bacterium]
MTLLTVGVLMFAAVHLYPGVLPDIRRRWQQRLGENGYKGLFSLAIATSIVLIVVGWRSAQPQHLYLPPQELRLPGIALVALAFWLFVVSQRRSRLRQLIRHPQLTGVLLWAGAHLLMNGDSRSVILFGVLGLWALIEILLINRREGVWIKGDSPPVSTDIVSLLITAVVVVVLMHLHPWFAGMPVFIG